MAAWGEALAAGGTDRRRRSRLPRGRQGGGGRRWRPAGRILSGWGGSDLVPYLARGQFPRADEVQLAAAAAPLLQRYWPVTGRRSSGRILSWGRGGADWPRAVPARAQAHCPVEPRQARGSPAPRWPRIRTCPRPSATLRRACTHSGLRQHTHAQAVDPCRTASGSGAQAGGRGLEELEGASPAGGAHRGAARRPPRSAPRPECAQREGEK